MFRRFAVVAALGLLAIPAFSFGQFRQGDWELTLGATGANSSDFDGFTAGGNASVGYFFTNELELSVRQSITYTDVATGADGSVWNGSKRVALDYHFDLGRWQPFVGANIGYVYGESTNDTWEAAPEVGVKYFVNATTFVYGIAEYQFFFDDGDDVDDAFDDGQFVYTVGIGFRF